MLELREVGKRWSGFELQGVDLQVQDGEYFVLLGPSGAGKSLLLELIAGFHAPDTGAVILGGEDVTRLAPERRGVGFVHQDSMLFPHMTARRNIAYGLHLRGMPPADAEATVAELAGMLHITRVLDRAPDRLSGGERQRVAIARALAVRPRVLLLDEPLGALDLPIQARLRAELKRVHAETGVTVLHVTHNQDEARELGHRIGVMRGGRLVQVGAAAEVFDQPSDLFVAEFTGCRNIYEGLALREGEETIFRVGDLDLRSTTRIEGPALAAVRSEHIIVSTEPVHTSARNQIEGAVEAVERQGHVHAVTARFNGVAMTSLLTGHSLEEFGIEPGRRVYFSFKANGLHLIPAREPED